MAKAHFSMDAFTAAAEKVDGGGDGDFPIIAKGTYLATVEKAFFEHTDNGAEMVKFWFQIDADDNDYANQYVFFNQNLVMISGEENQRGLEEFVKMLYGLTDKQAVLQKFAALETRDTELEKLLGTKVKIHVTPKTEGEYTNYTVKIRALLENVYAKDSGQQLEQKDITTNAANASKENEVKLEPGMKLAVTREIDGNQVRTQGTCLEFIDTGVAESSMIMFDPDRKDSPQFAIKPSDDVKIEIVKNDAGIILWNQEFLDKQKEKPEELDEIEEIDVAPEWELVAGGPAAFTHKGTRHSGLVKCIYEDDGKALIAYSGKEAKVPIKMLEKP